jgi:hypothetical protein
MAYAAILKRIRLLIPAELEGHYKAAVCRGFEEGDLTAPTHRSRTWHWLGQSRNSPATPQRSFDRDTRETPKFPILISGFPPARVRGRAFLMPAQPSA